MLLTLGCEESYKPAAYKAAPRVDANSADDSSGNAGNVNLPDITDWTSPSAVRKNRSISAAGTRGYRGIGYRGIGGYRGISRRGYSGVAGGYRGYGAKQGQAYRGYGQQRSYRGN